MAGERQMWESLRPHLVSERLDPIRVENHRACPGTPDVNYTHGWVELKAATGWPKLGGPLRLDHPPDNGQRIWLRRRWNAAPNTAWLLLRVGPEWLLFQGNAAAQLWSAGRLPSQKELRGAAKMIAFNPAEVASYLARTSKWRA